MSPTVKLRNATRSERRTYYEIDTDSETSEHEVKPIRQQPSRRKRTTYTATSESEDVSSSPTDVSSEGEVANVIPITKTRTRLSLYTKRLSLIEPEESTKKDTSTENATRAVRPKRQITYVEISSDDDTTASPGADSQYAGHRRNGSTSSNTSYDGQVATKTSGRSIRTTRGKRHAAPSQNSRIKFPTTKRQKIAPNTDESTIVVKIPPKARIPPWQTLPWNVLRQIMQDAAYPLYDGASKDTGSMRWLLNTSETCKSFHDACIGALMYDPPLYPSYRAQYVMSLLRASKYHYDGPDQSDTTSTRASIPPKPTLDYRKKIKTLSIEVKDALVRKAGIDFSELIKNTPLLKNLRFYHNHDNFTDKYIWALPENDRSKVKWSYDMNNVFKSLDEQNIALHSFEWNGRFLRDDPDLTSFSHHNQSSACLQKLKSLTIRNVSLPGADKLDGHVKGERVENPDYENDEKALKLISWRSKLLTVVKSMSNLAHLTLHSCNIIDDDVVSQLPDNLVSLTLTNLPFVRSEGLASYLGCVQPSLTKLSLNGNQCLSLEFMDTLATDTPNLAILEIDMTYHDPTSYHDTTPLFDDLLPSDPPTWPKTLRSISLSPLRNMTQEDAEPFFQSLVDAQPDLPHLRVLILRTFIKTASWRDRAKLRSTWDALLNQTFNIKYNEAVHAPVYVNPKTGRQSRSSTSQSSLGAKGSGRCHIVEIELSDQRPAQEQFKESDFLDSEPEGDGEWNANADAIEAPQYSSRRYAW